MYQYTKQDSAKQCFNASKVTSYILVILSTLLSLYYQEVITEEMTLK